MKATAALLAILFLLGCDLISCDEDHSVVEKMRNVPDERWARLMQELDFAWNMGLNDRYDNGEKTPNIPESISDLGVVSIIKNSKHALLLGLARCFDHGIHLHVEHNQMSSSVRIKWGEHESAGSEVLWTKNS